MTCRECGRLAPPDPETGYDADDLCLWCAKDADTGAIEDGPEWDEDTLIQEEEDTCPS